MPVSMDVLFEVCVESCGGGSAALGPHRRCDLAEGRRRARRWGQLALTVIRDATQSALRLEELGTRLTSAVRRSSSLDLDGGVTMRLDLSQHVGVVKTAADLVDGSSEFTLGQRWRWQRGVPVLNQVHWEEKGKNTKMLPRFKPRKSSIFPSL